jgi:transposase
VFDWRRQARRALEATTAPAEPAFVPVVRVAAPEAAAATAPARPTASVEVRLSGAVLRVAPGTDIDLLTTVLRAIRASAA